MLLRWILLFFTMTICSHAIERPLFDLQQLINSAIEALSSVPSTTPQTPLNILTLPISPELDSETQKEFVRMFHLPADIARRLAVGTFPPPDSEDQTIAVTEPVVPTTTTESTGILNRTLKLWEAEIARRLISPKNPVIEPNSFYFQDIVPNSGISSSLSDMKYNSNSKQQLADIAAYDKQNNYAYSQVVNTPFKMFKSIINTPAVMTADPTFQANIRSQQQSQIIPLNDEFEVYSHSPVIPKKFPHSEEFRRKQISAKVLENQLRQLKKVPSTYDYQQFNPDSETEYLGRLESTIPEDNAFISSKMSKLPPPPELAPEYFKSAVKTSLNDENIDRHVQTSLSLNVEDQQQPIEGNEYEIPDSEKPRDLDYGTFSTWRPKLNIRKMHSNVITTTTATLTTTLNGLRTIDVSVSRQFCANLRSFARQFGINDVAEFASTSCEYIQNYYTNLSCNNIEDYARRCILIMRKRV